MKRLATLLVGLLLVAPVLADEPRHKAGGLTNGEVRKVDAGARRITIKHGPIRNLEMPAMTMVFQVQDAALLAQLRAGDVVRFRAEQVGDVLTVTAIEKAQ